MEGYGEPNTQNWKEFRLGDLFKISKCKAYNFEDFSNSGIIPYITRTSLDNGVDKVVSTDETLETGNSIVVGGESAVFFYQPNDFICGTNITKLSLSNINEYIALFIITVANIENYRFSYSRALNKTQITKLSIQLPVDQYSNPNWQYMEDYVKSIYDDLKTEIEEIFQEEEYKLQKQSRKPTTLAV